MIKTIFVCFILWLVAGCKSESQLWVVECDSGFKTPYSTSTGIHEGNIYWRVKGGITNHRKMIPGEICQDIKLPRNRGK